MSETLQGNGCRLEARPHERFNRPFGCAPILRFGETMKRHRCIDLDAFRANARAMLEAARAKVRKLETTLAHKQGEVAALRELRRDIMAEARAAKRAEWKRIAPTLPKEPPDSFGSME